MRSRRSRTATVPVRTMVSVPSQRSRTPQSVPRTVAAANRPVVWKRPFALPRNRPRSRCPERARVVHADRRGRLSRRTRSVSPPSPRTWRIWKTPPWNRPVCERPLAGRAEVSATSPALVSTTVPTGTSLAPVKLVKRVPPTATRTLPLTGWSMTLRANVGCEDTTGAWPLSLVELALPQPACASRQSVPIAPRRKALPRDLPDRRIPVPGRTLMARHALVNSWALSSAGLPIDS